MLWNQQVHTDRTIPNKKPDITTCDNEKEHACWQMLRFQETEMWSREKPKCFKHKGYKCEEHVWNIKEEVIPVVKEEAESVAKSFKKYMKAPLESTTSRNCRKQRYKLLCTNVEVRNIYMGKSITCKMYPKHRIGTTRCTKKAWFVSSK